MKIYKIPEPALLHLYQNGNYDVKIYSDGTKVRTTEDDEFIAQFPENIDCKITNKCDMGCAFCHENSVVDGEKILLIVMVRLFVKRLPNLKQKYQNI